MDPLHGQVLQNMDGVYRTPFILQGPIWSPFFTTPKNIIADSDDRNKN